MVAELWGEYGRNLLVAVIGVGLALVCLVGILWIVRGRRGPSPFVRGGRNRQPRLQVLDAAAVDARRRLVLIRRDDVEHLIMIGGPTDVVIESRIVSSSQSAEPSEQEVQPAPRSAIPVSATARPSAAEPARRPVPASAQRVEIINARDTNIPSRENRGAVSPPQPAATVAANTIPAQRLEPVSATPTVNPARIDNLPSEPRVEPKASAQPSLDDAARFLDSQRERVFIDRNPPASASAAAVQAISQPTPAAAAKPTGLGSDFEKILEEEMAQNMAAREPSLAIRTNRPSQPAGSAIAVPVVAAPGNAPRDEPSLQSEVARIFGEMSASREK